MLVLTRKVGESIESSGPCRIVIVAAEAGRVRIGLDGPEESEFVRSELLGGAWEMVLPGHHRRQSEWVNSLMERLRDLKTRCTQAGDINTIDRAIEEIQDKKRL